MSGLEYFGRVCRWFGWLSLFIAGYLAKGLLGEGSDDERMETVFDIGILKDPELRSSIPENKLAFFDNWVLGIEICLALSIVLLILGYAAKSGN